MLGHGSQVNVKIGHLDELESSEPILVPNSPYFVKQKDY
jgi:hypothetical protein